MKATTRKQPSQSRSKVTVDCILAAAAHILQTSYPGDFNTNAIALRAGVSIGSLYQYFPSKEAIALALILREKAKVLAEIEKADHLARSVSFAEALISFLAALVQFQIDAGALHRNLEIEESRFAATSELRDINRRIAEANRELFSQHISSEAHRPGFVDDTANDIRCIVKAIMESELQKDLMEVDYLLSRVSKAVFGYLQAMGAVEAGSAVSPAVP